MGDFAVDRGLSQLNTSTYACPSVGTRQSVTSTGNSPQNYNDASVPAGMAASVSTARSVEAKKARCTGVQPLAFAGECYAVIQMTSDDGGGVADSSGFENFFLTSVRRNREERFQIFETFKLPILYVMDEAPSVYSFTGTTLSGRAQDGVWSDQFARFYQDYLRATAATEAAMLAVISYNSIIVYGYVLNFRMAETSEHPAQSEFSFDLFVTGVQYLG